MAEQENYSGVEVIIRLKPLTGDPSDVDTRSCVTLSPTEDNTVVVETASKKQYFSFDHVAGQHCQQSEIYDFIGRPVLTESLKGYNCCVFAYGQTGAGKTFSILGDANELAETSQSESRGVLPRLLEDLFQRLSELDSKATVRCSYLQIYNEQIIDLLNKEIRVYPIRQDCKKGVYVQGLSEESINSYEESLQHIFKGLKNRKVASTSMNSESSRSHSIFTINVKLQFQQNGVQVERYSKVHVVDLAGSERQRQVNVSGQRLKEGCNINRSLHCLGNVINSLVESIKKKKYVPFRDSKLTFFLKDSLGGNSKTKLLANINPRRQYLGDTISTLMFAKRAKILKVRVQPNQNVADNFEALRSEIRKLREELSQTKFIKNPMEVSKIEEDSKPTIEPERSTERVRVATDFDPSSSEHVEQLMDSFAENEKNYRMLIGIYEQRFARLQSPTKVQANFKHLFEEKRLLEKQNNTYAGLLANFPGFTRLFKDNLELKRKVRQLEQQLATLSRTKEQIAIEAENLRNNNTVLKEERDEIEAEMINYRQEVDHVISTSMIKEEEGNKDYSAVLPLLELSRLQDQAALNMTKREDVRDMLLRQNSMLEQYELAIEELKCKFNEQMTELRQSYDELQQLYEQEKTEKATIRKMKRPEQSPEVQTLENENEYLKLNIMELQNEINRYQQLSFKNSVQIRTLQEQNDEVSQQLEQLREVQRKESIDQQQLTELFERLREIKLAAERQNREVEQQRERDGQTYNQLRERLLKLTTENTALLDRNKSLLSKNREMRKKFGESTKSTNVEASEDFSLEDDNGSVEEASNQKLLELSKEVQQLQAEKQELIKELEEHSFKNSQDRSKLERASMKILCLAKQSAWLKQESHHEQQELRLLQVKFEESESGCRAIKQKYKLLEIQFNRSKKELEKREQLTARIRNQTSKSEFELFEGYKLMESQISFLKQELEKYMHDSRPKSGTGYTNSSRSLKTLNRLKDQLPNNSSVEPFSIENPNRVLSSVERERKNPKSAEKKERQNSLNAPKEVTSKQQRVESTDMTKSQPVTQPSNPSQFVGPFSKSKRAVVIPMPPALPKKK